MSRDPRFAGDPKLLVGYRAYAAEMARRKPGWRGFELAPDQTHLLVVGPSGRSS